MLPKWRTSETSPPEAQRRSLIKTTGRRHGDECLDFGGIALPALMIRAKVFAGRACP
jgi:hypothetical protein